MRGDGAAWACVPLSVPIGVVGVATWAGGVVTPSTSVSGLAGLAWSNAKAELSRRRFSVNGEGGE